MRTVTDINEEIKYRGYTPNPKIIIPSKNLLTIGDLITHTQDFSEEPKKERLKAIIQSSQSFYNRHFKLQQVPFYNEKTIGPITITQSGECHPFKIPIKRIKGENSFFGCLREVLDFSEDEIEISFRKIELSTDITEITRLSYTHEISHTQLNHIKGLIKEYYNTEVISVLLETIHALEHDSSQRLLRIHDRERLSELKIIIDELKAHHKSEDQSIQNVLIEGSLYAESTLKAYNLFITYYFGSNATKNNILKGIQRLFNRELSLEDLLDEFGITFDNSQDVQRLEKYIKR